MEDGGTGGTGGSETEAVGLKDTRGGFCLLSIGLGIAMLAGAAACLSLISSVKGVFEAEEEEEGEGGEEEEDEEEDDEAEEAEEEDEEEEDNEAEEEAEEEEEEEEEEAAAAAAAAEDEEAAMETFLKILTLVFFEVRNPAFQPPPPDLSLVLPVTAVTVAEKLLLLLEALLEALLDTTVDCTSFAACCSTINSSVRNDGLEGGRIFVGIRCILLTESRPISRMNLLSSYSSY